MSCRVETLMLMPMLTLRCPQEGQLRAWCWITEVSEVGTGLQDGWNIVRREDGSLPRDANQLTDTAMECGEQLLRLGRRYCCPGSICATVSVVVASETLLPDEPRPLQREPCHIALDRFSSFVVYGQRLRWHVPPAWVYWSSGCQVSFVPLGQGAFLAYD
jgi:hypothetical protein